MCGNYGQFAITTPEGEYRHEYSHRFAWTITNGSIPENLNVLHKCDNPPCCNPSMLFLGTQLDNMRDMDQKGRRATPRGEERATKLSQANVNEIRKRCATGASQTAVAFDFGVSPSHVNKIVRGLKWR